MYGYHHLSTGKTYWNNDALLQNNTLAGFKLSKFFRSNRGLTPKFLISHLTPNFTHNKYYPNLVNGANTRTLVIARFFDLKSVSWFFPIIRFSFFLVLLWVAFALINFFEIQLQHEWVTNVQNALLWLSIWQNPVIIFIAVCLFLIFSLVWSPVFTATYALCTVLPLILFFKNTAYGLLPFAWFYALGVQIWLNATEESRAGKSLLSWDEVILTTAYVLAATAIIFFLSPVVITLLLIVLYKLLVWVARLMQFVYKLLWSTATYNTWSSWYVTRYWFVGIDNVTVTNNFNDYRSNMIALVRAIWWAGLLGKPKGVIKKTNTLPDVLCNHIDTVNGVFNELVLTSIRQHTLDYAGFERSNRYFTRQTKKLPALFSLLEHGTGVTLFRAISTHNSDTSASVRLYHDIYNILHLSNSLARKQSFPTLCDMGAASAILPKSQMQYCFFKLANTCNFKLVNLPTNALGYANVGYARGVLAHVITTESTNVKALQGIFNTTNTYSSENYACGGSWALRHQNFTTSLRGFKSYERFFYATSGTLSCNLATRSDNQILTLPVNTAGRFRLHAANMFKVADVIVDSNLDMGSIQLYDTVGDNLINSSNNYKRNSVAYIVLGHRAKIIAPTANDAFTPFKGQYAYDPNVYEV